MTFKEAYDYLENADELNICAPNDREALATARAALKWAYQVINAMGKLLGKNIEREIKIEERK